MKTRGTAMVLLSGILWGCSGIFIIKLNSGGLGAMQISMVHSRSGDRKGT